MPAPAVRMWHRETPFHWAASNGDVVLIDALIDAGADIKHDGSSIDGGSPLSSAIGYGQWAAARRLVERGARTLPLARKRCWDYFRRLRAARKPPPKPASPKNGARQLAAMPAPDFEGLSPRRKRGNEHITLNVRGTQDTGEKEFTCFVPSGYSPRHASALRTLLAAHLNRQVTPLDL
jgi:hypothetical protein